MSKNELPVPGLEDDDDDEWLFQSIDRYEDLFMYSLQFDVFNMAWIHNSELCVSGTGIANQHEILQLKVPGRLLSDEGTERTRDFQIRGGSYCKKRILDLCTFSESNLVAAASAAGVDFYSVPDESDDTAMNTLSISQSFDFQTDFEADFRTVTKIQSAGSNIILGEHTSGIYIADIETKQYDTIVSSAACRADRIARICPPNADVVVICTQSGSVWLLDLRQKGLLSLAKKQSGSHIWDGSIHVASNHVYLLSNSAELKVFDLKQCKFCEEMLIRPNADKTFSPLNGSRFSIENGSTCDQFSVCGFDSRIYVFERTGGAFAESPTFVYDGHHGDSAQSVFKHMWHPTKAGVIVSSASDCNLHAWKWKKTTHLD